MANILPPGYLKWDGSKFILDPGTSGSISGDAGGDLSGTYPDPVVSKVNGTAITDTPSANQVLTSLDGTSAAWAEITNIHVGASAAIAGTKISPNFGSQTVTTAGVISAPTFEVGSTINSPTITSGIGVPVTTPEEGSLYLRTNGDADTAIYVYQDGTWTAINSSGGGFTAGGDLTGSSSSQTIDKLQGTTLDLSGEAAGHFIRHNGSNWISVAEDSISLVGDVAGNVTANVIEKLRGFNLSATAPVMYQVLFYDGSQWIPTTLPDASTGDKGFVRLAGDLSGTASLPTVVKANGATVPLAGSLTTGNVLQVSGASALSYGPLNFAGGSNYVTGTLPLGNLPDATTGAKGIVQLAGDLAGTASLPTVVKANGATVPLAGSLTTGNVLQVSGVSALSYGPLNLAGGADYVTGTLPLGNLPDATTGSKGIIQLAGDIAGTATSVTVSKINGSTVPAGGSLTTGTILRVTGASTLAYGALDLANVSAVTGILPSANLFQATTGTSGAVRLTGDLGGTAAAPTVVDLTITSEATGSMIYFNGTNWVNRSAGTANYILTANGAAAPTWNNAIVGMTSVRSNLFRMDPASGSAGYTETLFDTASTTSNTQATVRTISVPASYGLVVTVTATAVDGYTGYSGTQRVYSCTKAGRYYRASAGSLKLSDFTSVQDLSPNFGTADDLSLDLVISSNDLQIKVTGQASNNAKWTIDTTVRWVAI